MITGGILSILIYLSLKGLVYPVPIYTARITDVSAN